MIQHLKKPIKPIWYLLALFIIVCALIIQAARTTIPYIAHYKSYVEAFASRQLQAKVRFGHISGHWSGLLPEISLNHLSIVTQNNQPVLSVDYASMSLDILASLWNRVPVWRNVELQGLDTTVLQNKEGGWSLGGLAQKKNSQRGWRYQNPGSLFLMARHVSVESSDIHFIFHNGRKIVTSIPSILIRNDGHFHRLNIYLNIDDENVLNFIMEGVGDPADPTKFRANAFLELNNFPVEKIARLFTQVTKFSQDTEMLEANSTSNVDVKLWFDFTSPSQFLVNGDIDLVVSKPSEFAKENFLDIPFQSDIHGDYSIKNGLRVGLRNGFLDKKISLAPSLFQLHDDKLKVAMEAFDLKTFFRWFAERKLASDAVNKVFKTLSLSGEMQNLLFTLDLLDIEQSFLQANIRNGESQPWNKVPGFSAINGFVEVGLREGLLLLETENFSIHPSSIYEQPLSAKSAKGLISWSLSPENNRISVFGEQLKVAGDFGLGYGFFELFMPWRKGSYDSALTLQIGLKDSHSDYYSQFLPNVFPAKLRDWMSQSIESAEVKRAGFIYRGALKKSMAQNIQFFADIENGLLKIKQWPDLSGIKGQFVVDNTQLDATVTEAGFYNDQLSGRVSWNKRDKERLHILAKGVSPADSGLTFIQNSLLNEKTTGIFENWSATGSLAFETDISLALVEEGTDPKIKVVIDFNNNQFNLGAQNLELRQVNGKFFYSSKAGFASRNLRASLFNNPLSLNFEGGNNKQPNLLIIANGSISAPNLATWLNQPIDRIAEGKLNFFTDFYIPLEKGGNKKTEIIIRSDLKGFALNLPEPYFKTTSMARPIEFSMEFGDNDRDFSINYFDKFIANGSIRNNQDFNLVMSLSDGLAQPRNNISKPGVHIYGRFNSLDTKSWIEPLKKIASWHVVPDSTKKSMPFSFDVAVNDASYGQTKLARLYLSGERTPQFWDMSIYNPRVEGNIRVPHDNSPWLFNLDSVQLSPVSNDFSRETEKVDFLQNFTLESIHPINVTIQKLSYQEKQLGRWSFRVRTDEEGVELQEIKANIADFSLQGKHKNEGAYLRWQFPGDQEIMRSRFSGVFTGGNIKTLFESFRVTSPLESETTNIAMAFEWPGSPADISAAGVNGQLDFTFSKGLFVPNKKESLTGLLKLFGLMNFDTWARRIRLDFSDLYKQGLVYDKLQGKVAFKDGLVKTQFPIIAEGPSIKLALSGQVNYQTQLLDGELVVTLPISGNLTIVTALAAGLPAAAGVYFISKFFKEQMDTASSIYYDISGDVDNPVIKVRVSEQSAPENDVFSEDGLG